MKIISILVSLFIAVQLQAVEQIGQIAAISGQATGTAPEMSIRDLVVKSPIYMGDVISTAAKSKLQILFEDDSIISQGERSEMIIDEYVYSPNDKDNNSSTFSLVKGAFRVITGQITKLNPNRFKVKTKLATIGIRGCDLYFRIGEYSQDIFIVTLHGRENVFVQATKEAQNGWDQKGNGLIKVLTSGKVISIHPQKGMHQRDITSADFAGVIGQVQNEGDNDADPEKEQGHIEKDDGGQVNATDQGVYREQMVSITTDAIFTKNSTELEDATIPQSAPSVELGADTSTSHDPIPDSPVATETLSANGEDWSWGIWTDLTTPYDGNFISSVDVQSIIAGATLYNLTGQGSSGAIIQHGGQSHFVSGLFDVNVQIGSGVAPGWDGNFNLHNSDGDSLNFEAYRNINANGSLGGTYGLYDLNVSGNNFGRGTITANSINGHLVGQGSANPAAPISGIVGEYNFTHGANAQVDGVFGSDLDKK